MSGIAPVQEPKKNDRDNNQEPERQMSEKHELIDVILVEFTALELKDADPQEIKRVERKQHEGTEDPMKEKP